MPRLLLVDDNPSIHRIAESLLSPTDVELVCVDSAAEALDRLARGERFDVALVDTAMPGMDGWTLLGRLRAMEGTARMPIALMAGVLDPVDPAKLAKAPIQGFLKKPIELRELGDRVKTLLATPVAVEPSPFSTVPSTPAKDLVKRAEAALPEFRPAPEEASAGLMEAELDFPEAEEDLLILDAGDLWPEEVLPVAEVASSVEIAEEPFPSPLLAVPDVHLELEELDFDSLQDLTSESLPALEPAVDLIPELAPELGAEPSAMVPEEDHLVTLSGLEELDAFPSDFQMPPPAVPSPALDLASEAAATWLPAIPGSESAPAVPAPLPSPWPEPDAAPAAIPAAGGQAPAAAGQAAAVSAVQAQALVQALLADPVLVDALVKAVVARMGDQVLREIAWEVMPDLAGRLQR